MKLKTNSERATFLILMGCAFYLMGMTFYPLWKPLLLGAVVASVLDGWNERVVTRFRGRRKLAAAATTVAVLLLVLVPLGVVVGYAVKEAVVAVAFVRSSVAQGAGIEELIELLPDRLGAWVRHVLVLMPQDALASGGTWVAEQLGTVASVSSEAGFQVAIAIVTLYFLLIDGRRLAAWCYETMPLGNPLTRELLIDFRAVSRAVIGSALATSATQGVLATIGYLIARVPSAFFFGLLTFFASFVPAVGTSLVAVPLVVVLLVTGHTYAAIFLLAWAVLVIGMVDNFLKPLLVRTDTMSGSLVFLSFIGGLLAWGGIGLLAGPLAVAFFLAMIRLWRSGPAPEAPQA